MTSAIADSGTMAWWLTVNFNSLQTPKDVKLCRLHRVCYPPPEYVAGFATLIAIHDESSPIASPCPL